MMRVIYVAVFGLVITAGCASKTRTSAPADANKVAAATTRADTLRAKTLAQATLHPGGRITMAEGSGKLWFPIEALQAEEQASVIVSFAVLPNGRVDRESRTIIYLEGHPLFAKSVCDYLLEARVTLEHPQTEPAFASYAVVFQIRNLPKPPPVGDRIDEMKTRLGLALMTRTVAGREEWLMARPSCSALKMRDM
jgi:hypothetical protein